MNNPKAFPMVGEVYKDSCGGKIQYHNTGMDLRDYFAGKAMVVFKDEAYLNIDKTAFFSYQLADAMLREREKTNGN